MGFRLKKFWKKNGGKWDIAIFLKTHFPIFRNFPGFFRKTNGRNGFTEGFPTYILFQNFFSSLYLWFLIIFSRKALTLVESRLMSLIGHNSGCLRPRRLKISEFSYLYVIKTWEKFEADPMTRPAHHCCFGKERLLSVAYWTNNDN